jgi:hypothetical protein
VEESKTMMTAKTVGTDSDFGKAPKVKLAQPKTRPEKNSGDIRRI